MKLRTVVLILLVAAPVGLAGVAGQAPPPQKVFTPASDPDINIRKLCSLPAPLWVRPSSHDLGPMRPIPST